MTSTTLHEPLEISVLPVKRKIVGARTFLRLINGPNRKNIKSTRYVAPRLGSKHFGKFIIEYEWTE